MCVRSRISRAKIELLILNSIVTTLVELMSERENGDEIDSLALRSWEIAGADDHCALALEAVPSAKTHSIDVFVILRFL